MRKRKFKTEVVEAPLMEDVEMEDVDNKVESPVKKFRSPTKKALK
jgi:hypothetical protein